MSENTFQARAPRMSTQNKLICRNSSLLIAGTVRQLSQDNRYRNTLFYCLAQYQHPKAFTSTVSLNLKEKSVAEQVCQQGHQAMQKSYRALTVQVIDNGVNSSARVQKTRIYISDHFSPLLSCFREFHNCSVVEKTETPVINRKVLRGILCI